MEKRASQEGHGRPLRKERNGSPGSPWVWGHGRMAKRRARAQVPGELVLPGIWKEGDSPHHWEVGLRNSLISLRGKMRLETPMYLAKNRRPQPGCSSQLNWTLPLGMVEVGWSSVFPRAGGTRPHYLPVNKEGTARLSFKDEPYSLLGVKWKRGDVSLERREPPPQPQVRALNFLVIIQWDSLQG